MLLLSGMLSGMCLWAQVFVAHDGFVSFFGNRPFENIRADNHEMDDTIDTKTSTPDKFPDLMAAALSKQDINQWAAKEDIVLKK